MVCEIKVKDKPGLFDAIGEGVKKDIEDLGIKSVDSVRFARVYFIYGKLSQGNVKKICDELLCDPVTQIYECTAFQSATLHPIPSTLYPVVIEVAYNPGVMDPWEESVKKGIRDLGIKGDIGVKTAKEYTLRGNPTKAELGIICEKLLVNKVIEHAVKERERALALPDYKFKLIKVDILNANDEKLINISAKGQLFLNLTEMSQIKKYFKYIGRNPTDCELETAAQTWSEHCGHKTFRGRVEYTEKIRNPKQSRNFKSQN